MITLLCVFVYTGLELPAASSAGGHAQPRCMICRIAMDCYSRDKCQKRHECAEAGLYDMGDCNEPFERAYNKTRRGLNAGYKPSKNYAPRFARTLLRRSTITNMPAAKISRNMGYTPTVRRSAINPKRGGMSVVPV